MKRFFGSFGLVLALATALASPAVAQVATGNVYGVVSDESGAVLPGVTVSISGATIAPRSTTTGSMGDFRFLNLDLGSYTITVELQGFSTVKREVKVSTGVNVNLTFGLKVARVEETVTVTAETPIVDTKKVGTSTNLSREELSQVPQARDPWAILRTIPGVFVDRVNIAGNESGQQANFTAKGASADDNIWNLDGVAITDMGASGSSPTYYDYDAFEEISVTTGGSDVRVATGGVSLNFVTKRGTNNFHGGARGFLTHDKFQSSNLPSELQNDARLRNADGSYRDRADHIQQLNDYGADLGGPVIKDKLWFYGSYGVQDIRLTRLNGTPDKTKLQSYNAKLNFQATPNDMISVFYFNGEKIKEGRSPGTGLDEANSYLFNQGNVTPDYGLKIPGMLKVEINHIFGPSFFMNAKYAYYGQGFGFLPRGDFSSPGVRDFASGTAYGTSYKYTSERPAHSVNLDATAFAAALGGNHELKFGFGWRRTPISSTSSYGGNMQGTRYAGGPDLVSIFRNRNQGYQYEYLSGYLGDTFTADRWTLNLGLRFDHQTGKNLPTTVAANPDFPTLLPALDFDGSGTGSTWNDLSPRVGISYSLGQDRKTVLRASYARYAGQMAGGTGAFDNPIGSLSYLQYYWDDANHDGMPSRNEVLTGAGLYYAYNIDPANPARLTSVKRQDPNIVANHDNEVIGGIEHELMANLAVSAAFTWRNSTDLLFPNVSRPRNGVTRADYRANPPRTYTVATGPYAGTYTAQAYAAAPGTAQPGTLLTNRPDYARDYRGVEVSITKRLSNNWMARVAVSYNSWVEKFPNCGDPRTDLSCQAVVDPTPLRNDALVEGGQVSLLSAGSGKGNITYTSQKWQIVANALYQLPMGFELSGSFFGRQGTGRPFYAAYAQSGEPSKNVLVDPATDTHRLADLFDLDLRLAKNVKFGSMTVTASAELFNVLNSSTELNRNNDVSSRNFNRLDEVMAPRVARFGLRLAF